MNARSRKEESTVYGERRMQMGFLKSCFKQMHQAQISAKKSQQNLVLKDLK